MSAPSPPPPQPPSSLPVGLHALSALASSSRRSASPPPAPVSGSRLHLHPTSTPPRLLSAVTGSSILSATTANSAKTKLRFGSATAAMGMDRTASTGAAAATTPATASAAAASSSPAAIAAAAAAAASSTAARDSVKSEAFAAFMAARQKAASSGAGGPPPSAAAAAALHQRSLIPHLATYPLGAMRVSSGGGQTVPAGGTGFSPFPSSSSSMLPVSSPSGSPALSSAGVPLYSPLASASPAVVTPTATSAPVAALPPLQPQPPLPQPSESVPQQATRRLALDAFLSLSLAELEPRHAHASQYHFLRGLHALRTRDWNQAEASLRRAQDLYATTIEQGSLLQRIEKQDSKDAAAAAQRASASAAPSRQASQQMPIDPFPASSSSDDIELTQPLSQPAAGAAAAGGAAESNARSAEDAPTPDLPPPRTAFVARKAADIKCCLATALWKRAFAEAESAASGAPPASAHSTPADSTAEPPLAESKRLFIEALTLEDGARLSTWNAFCLFLFAAEDSALAQQTLAHVIAEYQSRAQRRAEVLASRGLDPQQDEASFDAGTGIDDLQVNLALMQLLAPSGSGSGGGAAAEALLNTQDVLLHSSLQNAHHLPALNNYALLLMRQDRPSEAREHLEMLLRHDPGSAKYWSNLAVCIELQASTRCDPLPPLSAAEAAHEEAIAASASSLLLPLGVFPRPAASLAAAARDEALQREVKYCLEKAAFYEAVSCGSGGGGGGDGSAASSWPFRCNLATHLLAAARAEPLVAARDQHYEACEHVLLSIAPSSSKRENYAHVYSLLGSLYSARSLSAEQDGDCTAAAQFKSASLASFARALELDSGSTSAWNNLGVLHLTKGEVQQANPYWTRIIRAIKSGVGVGEAGAGAAPDSKIKSQSAAAATKDVYPECSSSDLSALRSRLSPSQLRALAALLCNLAISLQLSSRLPESERAYRDSLALVPTQAPVWMGLGNLLRQRGDVGSAIAAFGRALALRPDYALAYSNLSLAHIQQRDWLAAYYCLERAHSLGPQLLSVRSNRLKLGLLLTRMGFSLPLPPAAAGFDPLAPTPGLDGVFTANMMPMMPLPPMTLPLPMPLALPVPMAASSAAAAAASTASASPTPSVGFVPNAATAGLFAQISTSVPQAAGSITVGGSKSATPAAAAAAATAAKKQQAPSRKRGHEDDDEEEEEASDSASSTDLDDDGPMED